MQYIGPDQLQYTYHFAIKFGEDAGKILLGGIDKRGLGGDSIVSTIEDAENLNAVDIVTKTDHGSSSFVCPVQL